jgi:hypothetical protein
MRVVPVMDLVVKSKFGLVDQIKIRYRVRARADRVACRPPTFNRRDLHPNFNTP